MKGRVSNVVGGCFGMAAFAVAIIGGIASGNSAGSVIWRAIIAMLICYPIGMIIGMICEQVVENQVASHRRSNPAPPAPNSLGSAKPGSPEGRADEEIMEA